MNLPNILTSLRFLMIPAFVYYFFSDNEYGILIAGAIFIVAGLTDILDGYLARKFNQITDFGKLMDPAADKLMQVTAFVCLFVKGLVPLWMTIIIFIKEASMVLIGGLLYRGGTVVSANRYGKIASTVFYGALAVNILFRSLPEWIKLGVFVLAIILSLLAGVMYIISYKESIQKIRKN